jgi:DivIVA domain-containing protein
MDTTAASTHSALDALRTAEFKLSLRGYDVDEVDDFLERAAVEADQLREQIRLAGAQVAQANEHVRQLETEKTGAPSEGAAVPVVAAATAGTGGAEAVSKMIEMAERFVEQTHRDAEAEAAVVIAEAQERARQLASDAQQRLADEVARLEGLRQRLGEDVEQMTNRLETERSRLTGSLQDLLGWIDKNLQPAAALAAIRATSTPRIPAPNDALATETTSGETADESAQVFSLEDARREE